MCLKNGLQLSSSGASSFTWKGQDHLVFLSCFWREFVAARGIIPVIYSLCVQGSSEDKFAIRYNCSSAVTFGKQSTLCSAQC